MAYPPPAPKYVGPPAHDSGSGNKPIKRIVIHCTAGSDGKGAMGTANYFKQQAAGGSAHYVIDSDEVLQTAYDSVVCWHAPPNTHSLGVEMCCSLADKGKGHWGRADHVSMMKLTATLVAQLCLAYGIPAKRLTVAQVKAGQEGICGHVDVSDAFKQSSHWDPGPYFPWAVFMAMVNAEIARITKPATKPPVTTPPKGTADMAATLETIQSAVDGLRSEERGRYAQDAKWVAEERTWRADIKTALADLKARLAALEQKAV
jgi:N-acetylmuramoyl-L-alanine amidase CwlA